MICSNEVDNVYFASLLLLHHFALDLKFGMAVALNIWLYGYLYKMHVLGRPANGRSDIFQLGVEFSTCARCFVKPFAPITSLAAFSDNYLILSASYNTLTHINNMHLERRKLDRMHNVLRNHDAFYSILQNITPLLFFPMFTIVTSLNGSFLLPTMTLVRFKSTKSVDMLLLPARSQSSKRNQCTLILYYCCYYGRVPFVNHAFP